MTHNIHYESFMKFKFTQFSLQAVLLGGEMRAAKVASLLNEVGGDVREEESIAALQATGWDVASAARMIKLEYLLRSAFSQ